MKKLLITALLTVVTFSSFSVKAEAKRYGEERLYPQVFVVDEVNYKNDVITLRTLSGILYQWNGCEDWQVGDIAGAIMYNNETEESIKDDVIVSLEYAGYTDLF